MKIKNKIIKTEKFLVILALALALTNLISAFAVSAPYMGEEKELKIYPGQEKELEFLIQNGLGPEDITIKADIREGSEIIEIMNFQDSYFIPNGENQKINLKVSIPEEDPTGKTYNVIIGFVTATTSESGTFALGSGIEQNFKVIVGDISELPKEEPKIVYYIIGILIVAGIIIFFAVRKRREKSLEAKE